MRRWQILVIEDQEDGCPTVEFGKLFYHQVSEVQKRGGTIQRKPIPYLERFRRSLSEPYCLPNEWEMRAAGRREACEERGRRPIVDVERKVTEAWQLLGELDQFPLDMVFLDVRMTESEDTISEIESLIGEVVISTGVSGDSDLVEHLHAGAFRDRGGLFLFGRLLQNYRRVGAPQILIYSQSRDVRADYLPVQYAFPDSFRIIPKFDTKNALGLLRDLVAKRIGKYVREGFVRAREVRRALEMYREIISDTRNAAERAMDSDAPRIADVMSHPIGDGWVFATLFCAQASRMRSYRQKGDLADAVQAVEEIEDILGRADRGGAVLRFFHESPIRLLAHPGAVKLNEAPCWLPVEYREGFRPGYYRLMDLIGDGADALDAIASGWAGLDPELRRYMEGSLRRLDAQMPPVGSDPAGGGQRKTTRQLLSALGRLEPDNAESPIKSLDSVLQALPTDPQAFLQLVMDNHGFDALKALYGLFRGKPYGFPFALYRTFQGMSSEQVRVSFLEGGAFEEPRAGSARLKAIDEEIAEVHAFLAPSCEEGVGDPVGSLIRVAIEEGLDVSEKTSNAKAPLQVGWKLDLDRQLRQAHIVFELGGTVFRTLDEHSFSGRHGGLGGAIEQCRGWVGVTMESGATRRNVLSQAPGAVDEIPWFDGCRYLVSLPVSIETREEHRRPRI